MLAIATLVVKGIEGLPDFNKIQSDDSDIVEECTLLDPIVYIITTLSLIVLVYESVRYGYLSIVDYYSDCGDFIKGDICEEKE